MKANRVSTGINTYSPINFRNSTHEHVIQNGHDEFVASKKKRNNKTILAACGLVLVCLASYLTRRAGWWGGVKGNNKDATDALFRTVDEAKEYFEKLGIDTIFRDVTEEHMPLLNRIKNDIKKLKELGVKSDKPDSLTISDWTKASEYEELCGKRGVNVQRKENYHAFCAGDSEGKNHIFINGSHPATDVLRHEMGHANHHRGQDSFWEAKGNKKHDFADKQLEILGEDMKIYRGAGNFYNIFHFNPEKNQKKFAIPNQDLETRFVYIKNILAKMQEETNCYVPDSISEQVAYVFDGLAKGKIFSDEVMLYYDFAGGARIPNLKINNKTYDEYIESLYNNSELVQKLRDNIKILKL